MSEKAHVVVAQCLCCKILLKMDGFFFFQILRKRFLRCKVPSLQNGGCKMFMFQNGVKWSWGHLVWLPQMTSDSKSAPSRVKSTESWHLVTKSKRYIGYL